MVLEIINNLMYSQNTFNEFLFVLFLWVFIFKYCIRTRYKTLSSKWWL